MKRSKLFGLIKSIALKVQSVLQQFGLSPVVLLSSVIAIPRYLKNYVKFSLQIKGLPSSFARHPSAVRMGSIYPVLTDFGASAGANSGHYYHQDLYIAKKIFSKRPDVHLDIGSRIDGFIAHLLAFGQRTVLGDVRPIISNDQNLSSICIDLSSQLKVPISQKYDSISSLHVVEHVGLGRYGDRIDPAGHIKAIHNLTSLLSHNGTLYLSFPIAKYSRIEFNAHRVLSLSEAKLIFDNLGLVIKDFVYVDDMGNLCCPDLPNGIDFSNTYGLKYGCGIWTLTY